MRLNVGGSRARRWLGLPATRCAFFSNEAGGPAMYSDEMGPSAAPTDEPAKRFVERDRCNRSGKRFWPHLGVAPASGGGDCRMAAMSTRSSGHGMPWLLSSGKDGEVRIRGLSRAPSWVCGGRRTCPVTARESQRGKGWYENKRKVTRQKSGSGIVWRASM